MRQPVLATWLLRHFGSARMNDPLMGDLMEERQSGRSWLWFWKQVLVAVLAGLSRDIWNHKLLAFRAIAVGWLFWAVWFGLEFLAAFLLGIRWPHGLVGWILGFVVSGWVVARLHRPYHGAMALVYMGSEILYRELSKR